MKYRASIALIGLAWTISLASASAADKFFCNTYGHMAAAQGQQNQKYGCNSPNGNDLVWSGSLADHEAWCLGTTMAAANNQKIKRAHALQSCFREKQVKDTPVGLHGWCDHYSSQAIMQSWSANRHNCGFSGNRWNHRYLFHHTWCVRVPIAQSKQEMAKRKKMLAACGKVCDDYARSAVRQQHMNLERGCNLTGPRWSDDYDYHRNWCIHGENRRYVEREARARDAALANCKP